MASTDRGNLMIKLSELVAEHAEILATIETWDNGARILYTLKCLRLTVWLT